MKLGGASLLALSVTLAACGAARGDDPVGSSEQAAQPIDRLLIGRAATYPADLSLASRAPLFERSMAARRQAAWKIVEKVLMPVRIAAEDPASATPEELDEAALNRAVGPEAVARLTLPRFQTWYSREDVLPMFDRLFRALPDADKRARTPFSRDAIDGIFPWNATMATSLASFSEERLQARREELRTALGAQSLGKDARVLMSPDYVGHLLGSYGKIVGKSATECDAASDPDDFAPCLDGEFPPAAAVVKTRWMPSSSPIPVYDTSASALGEKLARGTFGEGDAEATPDETTAYSMQLTASTTVRLVALHIMTKELRDWSWITLWWSPEADSDFGADRPSTITGPFAHYKMCVVTAFDEKDRAPGSSFAATMPSLAAALDRAADAGPSTWCSNPYLETPERAATTNCIGCHQHGGTGETMDTILGDPERFPDFSRTKLRVSFPSDYAFTTDGGLDLAAEMRSRVESLTPALR